MCLKLNIDIFEKFLINRNWDKYINLSFSKLYYSLSNNHLIDEKFIYDFLKPLLLYSDLSENITLLEFYNVTKIELHIFTVKISSEYMTQIDINYK